MLSRRQRALLLALLTTMGMISWIDRVEGQAGSLHVSTDLEMYGVGGLSGGGHVTWTLTGDRARDLRLKVLRMFDAYGAVPRGFAYAGQATRGNFDGTIQSGEAEQYTNFLENELEGIRFGFSGTEVRFVRIDRADILEKGFPVERSTEGLVLTNAASTERLEIRFIFNARTVSENLRFEFSDAALAHALHRVFDLSQVQTGGIDPWPLALSGGWHFVTMTDTQPALWHGDDATWTVDPLTGRYNNGTVSVSATSTEPGISWTDLKFATWANVTFRYIGSADAGDGLRLQVATVTDPGPPPIYSPWVDLTSDSGDVALPAAASWRRMAYNLSAYVGQQVRFRLNFTSDATSNNAPGFFIRDFAINGASRYVGDVESSEVDYLVGTLSFQEFDMRSGRAHVIRAVAGEILIYGAAYNVTSPPGDTVRFRGFDVFENPQILFVILILAGYLTSWFQDRLFSRYRSLHPPKYQSAARRIPYLTWAARVLIALYVVFYFFPSLFVLFGASNAFVTGPAYWGFAIGSTVGLTLLTWFWYRRQAEYIPPEEAAAPEGVPVADTFLLPPPPPEEADVGPARGRVLTCAHCAREIPSEADAHKCRCGQLYHRGCAADIGRCPNCQRTFDISRPAETRMVTAKCPACGEIQVVPEGADLLQTRCEACAALLKEIERGYNYLVIAPENDLALEWFHTIVKRNVPGMAMSTTFPEKLRKEFGFEGVDLYWLTDTDSGPKSIDPKRLDFEMMRTLSNFIKRTKGGAVLLDGLEYLVVENSFDRLLKFIKKINDLSSVHEVTLIVPVTLGSMGSDEMTLLRKEFDRVIETSGRAAPAQPRP